MTKFPDPNFFLFPRRPGGEGRVRGAAVYTPPPPTSPSQPCGFGPSLSPQRAERG